MHSLHTYEACERILGPAHVTGQPGDEFHSSLTNASMRSAQCPTLNAGAGVV